MAVKIRQVSTESSSSTSCPKCGSKRLVKIDELNPDYNCVDCSSLIIGL